MLLMPKGIQRKIVGKELSQFGFNIIIAETGLDAIDKAMKLKPGVIMSTLVTNDLSGVELANIFNSIQVTRNTPYLLVTSDELDNIDSEYLPDTVEILYKGKNFSRDLLAFLNKQGFVQGVKSN